MPETNNEIDLTALHATAVREAKARAADEMQRVGPVDGAKYRELIARHLDDVKRELKLESTYQTDDQRSGLQFPDEPGE